MKQSKFKIGFVAVVTLLVLICTLVYVNQLDDPNPSEHVFVTIALDQTALSSENSSYEILRAVEHFSDVVLGWTIQPGFAPELENSAGYPIEVTGRRQEKQNLLFSVSAAEENFDDQTSAAFLSLVNSRLDEYNSSTNSAYLIALSSISPDTGAKSSSRVVLGFTLFAFVLSSLAVILWEYAYSRRS